MTVRPESTVAIILAASQFPRFSQLDSAAVGRSAKEFCAYLRHPNGMFLPTDNILELIDASAPERPADTLEAIEAFLLRFQRPKSGQGITDLLFYYVGHGDHLAPDGAYHLFMPSTDENRLRTTSLSVANLAHVLLGNSRGWRRYMIVDACFAGASVGLFDQEKFGHSQGPITSLCAASPEDRAQAPEGAKFTMFSGELLSLLWNGSKNLPDQFSIRAVGAEITAMLRARHGNTAVLPEVHPIYGDAADVGLFPNRKQTGPTNSIGRRSIFAQSESPDFHSEIISLMMRAHRVVLIGMGLNVLQQEVLAHELITRAKEGKCHLEIYLANPDSPDIQTRLIEEELGSVHPAVGRGGLRSRLTTFYQTWEHGRSDHIKLRVFPHYPAFALLIVDEEYFIYPYGCRILGNFSPVLRFSAHRHEERPVVDFLRKHYRNVETSSVELERALSRAVDNREEACRHGLALYFIPPESSPLYTFGAQLLGYDVRNQKHVDTVYSRNAERARRFGFHLTIADALYFRSEDELAVATKELRFLLGEYHAFELTALHIEKDFPAAGDLSLAAVDSTGTLEAIHCEVVSRVYPRSESSDYTLGFSSRGSSPFGTQRDELIMRRFRAPHILQAFRPHFTLQTNIPPSEQETLRERAESLFGELYCDNHVRVQELQVMTKRPNSDFWQIRESIRLG